MEGKKKNIFIGILGATTVAVAGVAVYFGLKYNSSRIEIARLQEVVNEPKQTEIVEKEKVVTEYAIPEINYENCLNPKEYLNYSKMLYIESEAYATRLNVTSRYRPNEMHIYISKEKLERNLPNLTLKNADNGYFSYFQSFDSNIKQVYIGGWGQTEWANRIIFCVLDDGSVYCLNLNDAIESGNFDNFVKLDEVSDIIEVGRLEVFDAFTVYAARKDGKFYDLTDILKNKGVVNW